MMTSCPFAHVASPLGLGDACLSWLTPHVDGMPRVAHRLGELDHLQRALVDAIHQQYGDHPVGLDLIGPPVFQAQGLGYVL